MITLALLLITSAVASHGLRTGTKSSALKCTFSSGDGTGGSEVKIGDQTGDECIKACMDRRQNDHRINGVTIYSNGKGGCWCEQNMNRVSASSTYKTCFLQAKKAPALKCTFTSGDGTGGSEVKIGDQTGDECIEACMDRRQNDHRINGVTI